MHWQESARSALGPFATLTTCPSAEQGLLLPLLQTYTQTREWAAPLLHDVAHEQRLRQYAANLVARVQRVKKVEKARRAAAGVGARALFSQKRIGKPLTIS